MSYILVHAWTEDTHLRFLYRVTRLISLFLAQDLHDTYCSTSRLNWTLIYY